MPFELGIYRFDVLSLFLACTGISGIFISLYLFRYRKSPGLSYLALLQLATAIWALFYFLEYSADSLSLRVLWSKFSYISITTIPVWFYLFTVNFTARRQKSNSLAKTALLALPVLMTALVFTNDLHHLNWKAISFNKINHTTIYQYGPVFWIIFIFIYSLLGLGLFNVLALIRRYSSQIHRSIWLIVLATLVPAAGNLIYIFKINPIPGFDWTPLLFFTSGLILTYFGIRYGAVDLIPFAREKLVDLMDDGFLLLDINCRVADINSGLLRIFGYKREQAIGKAIEGVLPQYTHLVHKLKRSNETIHAEIVVSANGEDKTMDMRATPLFDKNNMPTGYLLTFRDISVLKQHEATILQTNADLKQQISEKEELIVDLDNFAQTVAHDLRNTIGAIISLSEMIDDEIDKAENESIVNYNSIIHRSASKTFHIMTELLTMSRIRQNDIKKEPVEMNEVVDESIKRLAPLIAERQVQIIQPESWPQVKAIPSWLEEVWVNYISNAIKYGGEQPIVQVGAEVSEGSTSVQFWVKDNGNGLSLAEQEQLFTKHKRLEKEQIPGSGLGLYIVKRIVTKLGGQVGVSSNALPGEGCLFYFSLPLN